MIKVVKFVYTMIVFLFIVLAATNVEGRLFISFSYLLYFVNNILHLFKYIFSLQGGTHVNRIQIVPKICVEDLKKLYV